MPEQIKIISHSNQVESLLEPYREVIGDDFKGYRGHIYRALTYAMHFLDNDERYLPVLEAAFVFHDIGLWTDKNLAYLEPSEAEALRVNNERKLGLDPELLREVIHWHHKVTAYKGEHADIINAARKADWIDATQGKMRKGLSKEQIDVVEKSIPNDGFHEALARSAVDLGGSALKGNMRVVRNVFKW
jgi:hypothetical protein